MSGLLIPSYAQGFARSAAEAENPGLREGLDGLYDPWLGPTGSTVYDWSGFGRNGEYRDWDSLEADRWVMSPNGWVWDFTESGTPWEQIQLPDGAWGATIYPFTMLAWFRADSGFASHDCIMSWANNGATAWHAVTIEVRSDDTFRCYMYDGTARAIDYAINRDQWYQAAFVGESSTSRIAYVDGLQVGVGTDACTPTMGSLPYCRLGLNYQTEGTYNFLHGKIGLVAKWHRALSANEIMQQYVDPHAILRPRRRVIAKAPAAAAGAIMQQLQGTNLGADLYDGALSV